MKRKYLFVVAFLLVAMLSFSLGAFAFDSVPYKIFVNGKELQSDVPPQMIDGRTMVPVRFIAEALGARVEWDAKNNAVNITTQKPLAPPPSNNDIKITNTNSFRQYGYYYIVGEVVNNSNSAIAYTEIVATLYDSGKRMVNKEETYADPHTIMPGGKAPFKITIADENKRIESWELIAKWRWGN